MGNKWDKMNKASVPELSTITEWVNDELWNDLLAYMDTAYKARISIEYSGCGMAPGWNVKFKKAGKSLCTLYPQEGWFIALVVIGQKEKVRWKKHCGPLLSIPKICIAKPKKAWGNAG